MTRLFFKPNYCSFLFWQLHYPKPKILYFQIMQVSINLRLCTSTATLIERGVRKIVLISDHAGEERELYLLLQGELLGFPACILLSPLGRSISIVLLSDVFCMIK